MSELHRFFYPGAMAAKAVVTLETDTAKHIWQVLRMDEGDKLMLTDGKGTVAHGEIRSVDRHKCTVAITDTVYQPRVGKQMHLCVAFTRNNARNEWLLEKATELGVGSITPVITSRSQKTHIRNDRWDKILQSAILQSQQSYLPELSPIMKLEDALKRYEDIPQKFVAHCEDEKNKQPLHEVLKTSEYTVMFIGPEGDFSQEEINLCVEAGCKPVSLGLQRLRTETAAITAAAYFNIISDVAS